MSNTSDGSVPAVLFDRGYKIVVFHTANARRPRRRSAGESPESGKFSCCPCVVARFSLSRVCVVLVMRSHPPIAHMSHEVQGHRPAFSSRACFFFFKKKEQDSCFCSRGAWCYSVRRKDYIHTFFMFRMKLAYYTT